MTSYLVTGVERVNSVPAVILSLTRHGNGDLKKHRCSVVGLGLDLGFKVSVRV